MTDLQQGDRVLMGLNESSKHYHPFLKMFEAEVITATNRMITIKAPVEGATEVKWKVKKCEIDLLQHIIA